MPGFQMVGTRTPFVNRTKLTIQNLDTKAKHGVFTGLWNEVSLFFTI